MKLLAIFRFEFTCQIRRVSTWLCFAVLVFLSFVQSTDGFLDAARNGDHFLGAPFVIAARAVVGCLIWLLVAAYVAGDAAARDMETGMHPLTWTTPVTKAEHLGGRFLAACVLNALLLLAVPAGIVLAIYSPDVEAEIRGPFRPAAYLTAYALIVLPNAFVTTAIQFSFATFGRRAIASFLASVLLLVAVGSAAYVAEDLALWELGKLLDPIGFIALDAAFDGWTPIERNTRLVGLEGWWLANRLLWLAVALCTLVFTRLRFRAGHGGESGSRRTRDTLKGALGGHYAEAYRQIFVPRVARAFGLATQARQILAIGWTSFGRIAKSWGGLLLLALVAMFAFLTALEGLTSMGVPLLARTDVVLRGITSPDVPPAWFIIPLLIVFCSGELVWRERDAGVSEIVDAAPVPEWVLFLGKFTGLALVLVLCMALRMAAGILAQTIEGYHDYDIGLYVRTLFGLQLADYLLFALLALVVQIVVNQKHAGHVAVILTFVCMVIAYARGTHNLLVPRFVPDWTYTEMGGFGATLEPWLWFRLYWAAWALLFAVAARLLWVRGSEGGFGPRLRIARGRFTHPTVRAAGVAMVLIVGMGSFIFYNTNVLNAWETASDRSERAAWYERRYGRYDGIPQPRLTGTNLRIEIYPGQRRVEIRGTYRLVNSSGAPIDSVHLATIADLENGEVEFDRPARIMLADEDFGHRIYALEQPLQPGDSLRLSFEVRVERRGFRTEGVPPVNAAVIANGTYFTNQWLPVIGYQPGRELRDAGDRRTHGLAPRPAIPSLYDVEARQDSSGKERIAFESVVGTDEGQIAITPGALRRTWTEGGRRYFHYATDALIGNEYAVFSADYVLHETRWNDVAIQIYHHPGHDSNLERMVRSVRTSLDYYTKQFGPYRPSYIRLVERPGHGRGAHAEATTIDYQEGLALLNPDDGPRGYDLPFYVVAHEVAHQWWGSSWVARVEGAGFLSEALASFSAYLVVRASYGQEHLRRFLSRLRTEFEGPAASAVPLLRANNPYLFYRKGPFAMYAMSEYIGEARVNDALRRFLGKHGSGSPPLPTTLDLYRELQAVTPDSLHYLLHDFFEANTVWQLATRQATARQNGAGTWQVTIDVLARKVAVDTAGVETEVPMDDWVQIGVFAPAREGEESGEPLYMQMHRIRSGEQTITVTVSREPARAGIDPHHLLIDVETADNTGLVRVER